MELRIFPDLINTLPNKAKAFQQNKLHAIRRN